MPRSWGIVRHSCRRLALAVVLGGLGFGLPVLAGPVEDITKPIIQPPPADPEPSRDEPANAKAAPPKQLNGVIVKGKREQDEETVRQKLEKAIKPKPDKPLEKDLNKASDGMKEAAARSQDADVYRDHPGDPTTKFLPPVGDETNGCGADITKGCAPPSVQRP